LKTALDGFIATLLQGDEGTSIGGLSFPLAGKITVLSALFELDDMVFSVLSSSSVDGDPLLQLLRFFCNFFQQYLHAFLSAEGAQDKPSASSETEGGEQDSKNVEEGAPEGVNNLRSTQRGEVALKALHIAQVRFSPQLVKRFREASANQAIPSSSKQQHNSAELLNVVASINQTLMAMIYLMSAHRDIIGPAVLIIFGFIKYKLMAQLQVREFKI